MSHAPPSGALPDAPSGDPDASVPQRYLALLADVAERLLAAASPAAMVDELFALIRRELRLDVFFNYRLDGDRLVLEAHGGLSEAEAREGAELALGQAVCGCVARDRRPRHAVGVRSSDDPIHAFVRGLGIDAYACTPLLHGERLLGTLGFGRRWTDRFTADELRFLHTICHYVALAKYRLVVEAELRTGVEAHERLLVELNHRVRNALQVAVGLAASELAGNDAVVRPVVQRVVDRLQVLALAHRPLYDDDHPGTVDALTLLSDILPERLRIGADAAPLRLPVEQGAALALLVHLLAGGSDRAIAADRGGDRLDLLFPGPPAADASDRRLTAALLHQLRATLSTGRDGLRLSMPCPADDR